MRSHKHCKMALCKCKMQESERMCDHCLVSETTRMNVSIVARATVDSEHVCEAHRVYVWMVDCYVQKQR
jgi:hypothetical protein